MRPGPAAWGLKDILYSIAINVKGSVRNLNTSIHIPGDGSTASRSSVSSSKFWSSSQSTWKVPGAEASVWASIQIPISTWIVWTGRRIPLHRRQSRHSQDRRQQQYRRWKGEENSDKEPINSWLQINLAETTQKVGTASLWGGLQLWHCGIWE